MSDRVRYADADWTLAGINGEGLFYPQDHGIEVRAASTACWRGYLCSYAIEDGALLLEEVDLSSGGEAPALFGRAPEQTEPTAGFTASYRSLTRPMPFTGGLLLGRDFIPGLYVHMGFHPAWKYERVVELELEQGRVVRSADCSAAMAAIRERLAGKDQPDGGASDEEIMEWVAQAFSRAY